MARKKAAEAVEEMAEIAAEQPVAAEEAVEEQEKATVRAEGYSYVNVREKPSIQSKIISTVPCGFKVAAEPENGGWRRVGNGYIMADYLE